MMARMLAPVIKRALTLEGFGEDVRLGPTDAGETITPETSLQISAVYACVRVLSESIASLPLKVYERNDDGSRREAVGHPAYRLLHDRPNPAMTSFVAREVQVASLAMRGNAYLEKIRDRSGVLRELWPIKPGRVTMKLARENGRPAKRFLIDGGERVLGTDSVLHIPGLGLDGYVGLSPLAQARHALGLSRAAEKFGSKLFANGARPGGVLEHPGRFKSDDAARRLRESFERLYQGTDNSHRLAVLEEGMKYHEIGIPPEDAEFLATRKFQIAEIARIYRIPLHMLGELDRATFSNIEQQSLEFVVHTLRPWLVRIEQAYNAELFPEEDGGRYFAEFSVDGLLRGDINSRYSAYSTARQWGFMSINEIRRAENLNPLPAEVGDVYLSPLNMAPADQVGDEPRGDYFEGVDEGTKIGRRETSERSILGTESADGVSEGEFRAASRRHTVSLSYVEPLQQAAGRTVRRERGEVLAALKRHAGERDASTFREWIEEYYRGESVAYIRENFEPVFRGLFAAVAGLASDEVSAPVDSEKLAAWQRDYIDNFVDKYAVRSRKQIEALIREEREDFEEALETRLDEWVEKRPEKVASEERVNAASSAAKAVWAGVGYGALRWVTIGDSCPYCRAMNGRTVRMSEPFIPTGGSLEAEGQSFRPRGAVTIPPLHAGCNCSIVPA